MLSGIAIWIGTKVGGFAADKSFRKLETFTTAFVRAHRNLHPKTEILANHLEACATAVVQIQIEFEKIIGLLYWADQDNRMTSSAVGREFSAQGNPINNVNTNVTLLLNKFNSFAFKVGQLNEEISVALECDTEIWSLSLRDHLKPIAEEAVLLLRPSWGYPETVGESWRVISQAVEEQSASHIELLRAVPERG